MSTVANLDFDIPASHQGQSIDVDYRGRRITVYKNGDQYDSGTIVVISRKRFKHWLTFLDFLTKKLNLMAPVHELYRTDGIRIQHFEEIENGESYVAVSQGPFLQKPYGLTGEEREKWNIDPKIESPEPSTLDSAESVDIYLKQRGYTSRTGLPFPFDGGICVSHSLVDLRRSRSPSPNSRSTRPRRTEPRTKENGPRNDEVEEKQSREKNEPDNGSISVPKIDTDSGPPVSVYTVHPESETNPETVNEAHAEGEAISLDENRENQNTSVADPPNANTTESMENSSNNEMITQRDVVSAVSKGDSIQPVPIFQIPDSSREFPNAPNPGNMSTHEAVQPINRNYPFSPANPDQTIITFTNDEASVRASSNSVVVVNISTGHDRRRVSAGDVNSNSNDNVAQVIPPPVGQVTSSQVSSQTTESSIPPLSSAFIATDPLQNNIVAASKSSTPPEIVTTDSKSTIVTADESSSSHLPNTANNVTSFKNEEKSDDTKDPEAKWEGIESVSSKGQGNVSVNEPGKVQTAIQEQNLTIEKTELEQKSEQKVDGEGNQISKQAPNILKKEAELDDALKNLETETPLFLHRENENVPDNSGSLAKNTNFTRNLPGHMKTASWRKRWEDEEEMCQRDKRGPAAYTLINSNKSSPLADAKSSSDRKHVTLATPFITSTSESIDVDTDMVKLKVESGTSESLQNSEEKLETSLQQETDATYTATTTTTPADATTASTYPSKKSAAAKTPSTKKSVRRLQKYQPSNETSFEADFTPRGTGPLQKDTIRKKAYQREIDLELHVRMLQTQSSYDPDFKDYDFM